MRPSLPQAVEQGRVKFGPLASNAKAGRNGAFMVGCPATRSNLNLVVSDGMGWEHVSVSVIGSARCPTWTEMCFVKDLFWERDECVIQYHPREAVYVRTHPYVLHLWKPIGVTLPEPDTRLIGDLTPEQKAM